MGRLMIDSPIKVLLWAHRIMHNVGPDDGVGFLPESLGLASKEIHDAAHVLYLADELDIYAQ